MSKFYEVLGLQTKKLIILQKYPKWWFSIIKKFKSKKKEFPWGLNWYLAPDKRKGLLDVKIKMREG